MKSQTRDRLKHKELNKQLTEALRKSENFIRVNSKDLQVRFTSVKTKYEYIVYFRPYEIVVYHVNDDRVVGKYDYDEFRLSYILKYL